MAERADSIGCSVVSKTIANYPDYIRGESPRK